VAQSPEYPDLKWVVPRSWTNANRSSVQLIVIHTTEGSAHGQSAEDGAAYDARRTDGTSAHYFVDSTSVVQCVRTNDQAHTARAQGNRRGIQYELCGRAGSQDWKSAYSQAMLARAAKQAARDARKWNIPVLHLTVAQVRAGVKGFCGHHDITRAFPADGGTHTDPGTNFPWSQFLDMVRAELAGKPAQQEDEVALATDKIKLTTGSAKELGGDYKAGTEITGETALNLMLIYAARAADDSAAALVAANAAVAAVARLAAKDAVDEQALAAVLAPAVTAQVLAGLPAGSDQVTQEEVNTAVTTAFRNAFAS